MYSKFGQERKQQVSRATPTCSKSVNSVKPMEGNNTFQISQMLLTKLQAFSRPLQKYGTELDDKKQINSLKTRFVSFLPTIS